MSDMPKRIVAYAYRAAWSEGAASGRWNERFSGQTGMTGYVRADIAEDLLAALKKALEAIERDPDFVDTYIVRTETRNVCRAAIAKAEGEA